MVGDLRDRKLRKLVRHAWENVPYYRRLFDEAGVHPDDIRGAADLDRIPVTTKQRRQLTPLSDRIARGVDPSRLEKHRTSGSTGRPDMILRTWWEDQVLLAHRLRAAVQLGARPHQRSVNVGISDTQRSLPHRLGLFPITLLDPYMDPKGLLNELLRIRPDCIRARPNVLERVIAEDTNGKLANLGTQIVFCGSEWMAPASRSRIEDAFRARVVEIYGANEFNMIAWYCADCGCFHTVDDAVYLEVLKDGRPAAAGEDGDVVATALHSFAMPYIRFETGDVARIPVSPPDCGITFGRFESLQGRACEFIRLGNGRLINPTQTFHAIREVDGVGRFEVVQTGPDRVRITIEPLPGAKDPSSGVLERCRRVFGDGVAIEIALVSELTPDTSRKHRFVRALE